jgi:hypothetical protein
VKPFIPSFQAHAMAYGGSMETIVKQPLA